MLSVLLPHKNELYSLKMRKLKQRTLQYIFVDIVGPFPVRTREGFEYFPTLIEKFSNQTRRKGISFSVLFIRPGCQICSNRFSRIGVYIQHVIGPAGTHNW